MWKFHVFLFYNNKFSLLSLLSLTCLKRYAVLFFACFFLTFLGIFQHKLFPSRQQRSAWPYKFFRCNFRLEVDNDTISDVAVDNVGMDVNVKLGDSKSNGFRYIRGADFVSNEQTNRTKPIPVAEMPFALSRLQSEVRFSLYTHSLKRPHIGNRGWAFRILSSWQRDGRNAAPLAQNARQLNNSQTMTVRAKVCFNQRLFNH